MELKVNEVAIPEPITFNYEELKNEITQKVSFYETLVYSDEQIKEAKTDRANLNKLKQALNDERIRREREYMQPFDVFKQQINEIIRIIDKPVMVIDKQVKEFEEKRKQEKKEEIIQYFKWQPVIDGFETLKIDQIFDLKWLNASVSMKSIQEDIKARLNQIKNDVDTLRNLPEFGFEAVEVYKTTLDINRALNEGKRLAEIAKKKAEAEQAKAIEEMPKEQQKPFEECMNPPVEEEEPEEVKKEAITFRALLSFEDAWELNKFMRSRNIEFEIVD